MKRLLIPGVLALVLCTAVHAQRLSLQARPLWMAYDAREYLPNGGLFNRDDGRLQGIELQASVPVATPMGELRLHASHRRADGDVLYLGLSQGGLPLITSSRLQLQRSEFGAERAMSLGSAAQLKLGALAQTQRLDRYIQPGLNLPLQELLREGALGLAIGAEVSPRHLFAHPLIPATLSLSHTRFRTLNSALDVNAFGVQDAITLGLGRSSAHRSQLEMGWPLVQGVSMHWRRSLERNQPTASATVPWTVNGVPNGTVRYPGAAIRIQETAAGLRFSW
jgi:hypothetical protein